MAKKAGTAAMMDVKEVVQISSDVVSECVICQAGLTSFKDPQDFAERINHMLKKHGCKLLHVGQETNGDIQTTVAVLGK